MAELSTNGDEMVDEKDEPLNLPKYQSPGRAPGSSVPVQLPLGENFRLLAYLKLKYNRGYFLKSDLKQIGIYAHLDQRTLKNCIRSLKNADLVGESSDKFFLRNWNFIHRKLGMRDASAFECSIAEIANKRQFKAKLFAAKIQLILKKRRRKEPQVRLSRCTDQSGFLSTRYLQKVLGVSAGKVSLLKKDAAAFKFLEVKSNYERLSGRTKNEALLIREYVQQNVPGKNSNSNSITIPAFNRGKCIYRRSIDTIDSLIPIYKIRARIRYSPNFKQNGGTKGNRKKKETGSRITH